MNIRFRGVEEVLVNWDKASQAILEAQDLELQQRSAFAPIQGYDEKMGYLNGKADAFIESAASDPDYVAASNVYPHFQAQYPTQDALGDTWRQYPQTGNLPVPFRKGALTKFETALTTVAAKLGRPAPTMLINALKAILP